MFFASIIVIVENKYEFYENISLKLIRISISKSYPDKDVSTIVYKCAQNNLKLHCLIGFKIIKKAVDIHFVNH